MNTRILLKATSFKNCQGNTNLQSGEPTDVTNYRPISVLPILSKIAERHVHNAVYSFLCENDLIYIRQSGFRSKHST